MAVSSMASSASLLILFLLFGFSSAAKDILVGGKTDAWKVPSSESDSLNKWAEKARFQVGDHLVWKYEQGKDSVLEVTKEDYVNCNTSNPLKEHNDGNTKVRLDRPGAYFFISGVNGNCEKGEKLHVVVMTPRGRKGSSGISISPSPSPSAVFDGPAVAPSPTSSASAFRNGLGFFVAICVGFFM